jgi:hypothetical protein
VSVDADKSTLVLGQLANDESGSLKGALKSLPKSSGISAGWATAATEPFSALASCTSTKADLFSSPVTLLTFSDRFLLSGDSVLVKSRKSPIFRPKITFEFPVLT